MCVKLGSVCVWVGGAALIVMSFNDQDDLHQFPKFGSG